MERRLVVVEVADGKLEVKELPVGLARLRGKVLFLSIVIFSIVRSIWHSTGGV